MAFVIDNLPEAIRNTKQRLRAALPEYKEIFREVEVEMQRRVEEIVSRARSRTRRDSRCPVRRYSFRECVRRVDRQDQGPGSLRSA